jgi:TolA-binding protein
VCHRSGHVSVTNMISSLSFMAQPNFRAIQDSLVVIAEEAALIRNIPVVPMQEVLLDIQQSQRQIQQQMVQMQQQMVQMQQQLVQMQNRNVYFQESLLPARMYNGRISTPDAPLRPLQNLDGNVSENFPNTSSILRDFNRQSMDELLRFYRLPLYGPLAEKKTRFADFIGLHMFL